MQMRRSLCVTGWSYGGYMTTMIITKTNRFKAAVVRAGMTDLFGWTNSTGLTSFLPDYFEGEMWYKPDVYLEHSAMAAVKNVKAPTLTLCGENDDHMPSQGRELYVVLKRMGVRANMVIYPRM